MSNNKPYLPDDPSRHVLTLDETVSLVSQSDIDFLDDLPDEAFEENTNYLDDVDVIDFADDDLTDDEDDKTSLVDFIKKQNLRQTDEDEGLPIVKEDVQNSISLLCQSDETDEVLEEYYSEKDEVDLDELAEKEIKKTKKNKKDGNKMKKNDNNIHSISDIEILKIQDENNTTDDENFINELDDQEGVVIESSEQEDTVDIDNQEEDVIDSETKESNASKRRFRRKNVEFFETLIPDYSIVDGHYIQNLRESINVTRKTFAQILGVTEDTVTDWETDAKRPNNCALRLLYVLNNHIDNASELFKLKMTKQEEI